MKCLKCNKEGCKYIQRKPEHTPGKKRQEFIRYNFETKCKHCGTLK